MSEDPKPDPTIEEFVLDNYERLCNFARKMGHSSEDALDIAYQIILRFITKVYDPNSKIRDRKKYLWGIAWNVSKSSPPSPPQPAVLPAARSQTEPDIEAAQHEQFSELYSALEKLSEFQRDVVILRYFASFSLGEIASALGRKYKAVQAAHVRALKKLRMLLGKQDQ